MFSDDVCSQLTYLLDVNFVISSHSAGSVFLNCVFGVNSEKNYESWI